MKPFIIISILFVASSFSAFAALPYQARIAEDSSASVTVAATNRSVQHEKLNWAQKLFGKLFHKKQQRNEMPKEDALATASALYGFGGLFALLLVVAAPPLAVLALPCSIAAIIKGKKALQLGTSRTGTAKAGKTLGIVTLILAFVGTLGVLIALANWKGPFGG